METSYGTVIVVLLLNMFVSIMAYKNIPRKKMYLLFGWMWSIVLFHYLGSFCFEWTKNQKLLADVVAGFLLFFSFLIIPISSSVLRKKEQQTEINIKKERVHKHDKK